MLWNRSLVMIDSETESLWSHLLGQAMQGKLAGKQLEAIPAEMLTWKAWRLKHPQTSVLNLSRTHRAYDRAFYRDPGQFVLGWIVDGQPHSVSMAVLKKSPVLNVRHEKTASVVTFEDGSTAALLFSRIVDKRELHFTALPEGKMKDDATGSTWSRATGTALDGPLKGKQLKQQVGIMSYAKAWKAFHPGSRVVSKSE